MELILIIAIVALCVLPALPKNDAASPKDDDRPTFK